MKSPPAQNTTSEAEPLGAHREHEDAGRDGQRHDGLDAHLASLPLALIGAVVGGGRRGVRGRRREGIRAHVIAGGLDGADEVRAVSRCRVVRDAGALGGDVDVGLEDTVGLVQEALDAIDTARASHALDIERDVERSLGCGGIGMGDVSHRELPGSEGVGGDILGRGDERYLRACGESACVRARLGWPPGRALTAWNRPA